MKPRAIVVSLAVFTGLSLSAAPVAKPDPSIERLMDVARVWVTADYFHPYLAYKNIDWEAALVQSLPKIRSAKNGEELTAALNVMLSALGDGATSAIRKNLLVDRFAESPQPQRYRFHHGLAREDGKARQIFFSGFATEDVSSLSRFRVIEFAEGVTVRVRISEPATTAAPAAMERKRSFLDDAYPSEEARILAAFRLWGAIRYFFAYKDLIDEDWDSVFAEYLPKIVAAKQAQEYHLLIAELVSHLSDSAATVESPVLSGYFGKARPTVSVRLIEKKPVITALSDDAKQAGAKLGDVITKVDGENSVERIRREANYLSASTPAGLSDAVARLLLNGAAGSPARLNVARAGGLEAEILLPRASAEPAVDERSAQDSVRSLPGGAGYIDMDRVDDAQLQAAYTRLRDAPALIVDLRGHCRANPYLVAEAFPKGAGHQAAIVTGPTAMEPDLPHSQFETSTSSYFQIIRVPELAVIDTRTFRGDKVVLLIDERTRSRAEQAALLLSAAATVEVIGSPSAGAPSEITQLRLPGNISVSFSGQDMRLINGGQIQRQGIQPTLTVPVTIAGVRAGRDQPLDVALAWLKEERSSSVIK